MSYPIPHQTLDSTHTTCSHSFTLSSSTFETIAVIAKLVKTSNSIMVVHIELKVKGWVRMFSIAHFTIIQSIITGTTTEDSNSLVDSWMLNSKVSKWLMVHFKLEFEDS